MSGCLKKVIDGVLIIFGIYIVVSFVGAVADPSLSTQGSNSLTVVYEVDSPRVPGATSSLTYANESGNTEQHTVSLPWRMEFEAAPGQFLHVTAQSGGYGNACRIKVNGVTVEQADSSGQYSIASCSGLAEKK